MIFHRGAFFAVEFTPDAERSLLKAEAGVPGQHFSCKAQLRQLMKRLADTGKLRSPEQFRFEEDQIFVIKTKCGLRAYAWFQTLKDRQPTIVISHFILKKRQKMDRRDLKRAQKNRRAYQEACT